MKRLVWIAIGAAVTVVVIRKGAELSERYLPAGARDAVGTVGRVTSAARTAKTEFLAGLAEREAELRTALLGDDADLDEIRSKGRAAWAELRGSRGPAAQSRRVPPAWASDQLEDPDDDDGYAFF